MKIKKIRKRSGRIVKFRKEKIERAIGKAFLAVGEKDGKRVKYLAGKVVEKLEKRFLGKIPQVEQIQDIVEEVLMRHGHTDVARAYILYRDLHARIRSIYSLVDSDELMDRYLDKTSWLVRENANMAYSLQGLNNHVASIISANYWLNKIYSPQIRQAHTLGDFHIHNLQLLATYCAGWDLYDLLIRGFGGVPGKIECKPAKHFRTALGQLVNFLYTLQGEGAGAQAVSSFDTLLAPFIRADKLTYKEVKQAMQEFIFNMNVPTRVGFQTPFSNVTLDLTPPSVWKNEAVIIGGNPQNTTYGDYQKEMDMFNKAFAEVMLEGDAKGRVFSVDYDSTSLIKNSGRIKLVKIGQYIDNLMTHYSPEFIGEHFCEVLDTRNLNIKTIGLKNGRLGWQKVNYLIRHPAKEILKITTRGGFTLKVTPSHSVLILKEGEVRSYPASSLKEGDYLVAVERLPLREKAILKISLAHEFVKKGKENGIFISSVFKNGQVYREKRTSPGKKKYFYRLSTFPLSNIAKKISKFDLNLGKLSLSGSKFKIANTLLLNEDLVEFLGWYLAEGSAEKNPKSGGISFGFDLKKEKETVVHLTNLIKKLFRLPVKKRIVKKRNLIEIRIHSKLLRRIITEVFEIGNKEEKKVPDIIFELPDKLKKHFLWAYFKGDGWLTNNIVANTVSKNLAYGVSTLLRQLRIHHTLEEYAYNTKPRFRIAIWNNLNLNPQISHTIGKIPIKESGLGEVAEEILLKEPFFYDKVGRRYQNTKKRILAKFGISHQATTSKRKALSLIRYAQSLGVSISASLKEIIVGDTTCLKTKKIEKIKATRGMVYDFSTESETFIADQFVVHNTFPIPTYNITKEFDWKNPNYQPIWEMTRKFGIPYFSNFINSEMKPEDVRSMCCRLRLDYRTLKKRGGGLFGANPLTGCYDEDTEILTEKGWRFFKDLTKDDQVFTLTKANQIELHKPVKIFKYHYKGEMYHFKTKSLDFLVTPNHRMVVDDVWSKKRKFVEAKDFQPNTYRIPKKSIWKGEEKEWFILPGIEFTKYGRQGRTPYQVIRDALKIKMDDWLKFFGFWLAEGSTDNKKIAQKHGYRVIIGQIEKKKKEEIKKVLERLPFNYYQETNCFVIFNKQLWSYLRQFGNCYTKFIPQEIKNLSRRQLQILFDWMVKGDGHVRKTTGQINYWTSSKKLADDLQEVILKLGWLGTLFERKGKVSKIKGRKINAGTGYTLGVQKAAHYRLRKENIRKVYYKGKVYCCEVKNHTVFVRRNGKVSWCGNSIGVITINMPRIGYLAKTEKEYFERLSKLMDLAKEALMIKRRVLEKFTEDGLYPYSRIYLSSVKERFGKYWKNHFSTIGLCGMNESLVNFMGKTIGDKEGRAFALEVLDFMRQKLLIFQKETGEMFNLEATPAEGTSYSLAMADKKIYPKIIVANEKAYRESGAAPYYTNSSQLPVNFTDDIFEALSLQDEIQTKYTGGCVFHGFLGESLDSAEVVKKLVKKIAENYHIPYFTLTPTFSICQECGYLKGEHEKCPNCNRPCEVFSRIVGYLRPVSQWNEGKRSEFRERRTFKIK